jgi:hypothetical protein
VIFQITYPPNHFPLPRGVSEHIDHISGTYTPSGSLLEVVLDKV